MVSGVITLDFHTVRYAIRRYGHGRARYGVRAAVRPDAGHRPAVRSGRYRSCLVGLAAALVVAAAVPAQAGAALRLGRHRSVVTNAAASPNDVEPVFNAQLNQLSNSMSYGYTATAANQIPAAPNTTDFLVVSPFISRDVYGSPGFICAGVWKYGATFDQYAVDSDTGFQWGAYPVNTTMGSGGSWGYAKIQQNGTNYDGTGDWVLDDLSPLTSLPNGWVGAGFTAVGKLRPDGKYDVVVIQYAHVSNNANIEVVSRRYSSTVTSTNADGYWSGGSALRLHPYSTWSGTLSLNSSYRAAVGSSVLTSDQAASYYDYASGVASASVAASFTAVGAGCVPTASADATLPGSIDASSTGMTAFSNGPLNDMVKDVWNRFGSVGEKWRGLFFFLDWWTE